MIETRCSRWVWWFGTPIIEIEYEKQGQVELFVRAVASSSGQKVDWFSGRGLAIVKACGNLDKVMKAAEKFKELFRFKYTYLHH